MDRSTKIAGVSDRDIRWAAERLYALCYGILAAIFYWILQRILWKWLLSGWIIVDTCLLVYQLDKALGSRYSLSSARYVLVLLATGWVVLLLRDRGAPALILHEWLADYIIRGWGLAYLEYFYCDGPSWDERCRDHRYAATTYLLCAYALTPSNLLVRTLTRPSVVGLIALALASWFLTAWTGYRNPIYRLLLALCTPLFRALMVLYDLYDTVEASINRGVLIVSAKYICRNQKQGLLQQGCESFRDEPLANGEIRLLKLWPSSALFRGLVRSSLVHVRLDAVPEYEALSYRWGDSTLTDGILVDGKLLPITTSALELLLSRRRGNQARLVWIDAICIDQTNIQEKTVQVQQMRQIYECASRVVIFPGESHLARLAAPVFVEQSQATYYQGRESPFEIRGLMSKFDRPRWQGVAWVLNNEYFTRAWIVQEILAGKNVELYLGGLYVPWPVFLEAVKHLMHPSRRTLVLNAGNTLMHLFQSRRPIDNILTIADLRGDLADEDEASRSKNITARRSLEALIFHSRVSRATDPRDLVFAFIGLATDCEDSDLVRPDYLKPPEQVFQNVAAYVLFHRSIPAINILSCAGTGFFQTRSKIPSWVPDFREIRWSVVFSVPEALREERSSFRASGKTTPELMPGNTPEGLLLKGVLCDEIISISTVDSTNATGNVLENTKEKVNFIHSAIALVERQIRTASHDSEVPSRDDLWLALCAGRMQQQHAVPPAYAELFKNCLLLLEKLSQAQDSDQFVRLAGEEEKGPLIQADADGNSTTIYNIEFTDVCSGRRFGISRKGRLCLLPPLAQIEDRVFIPYGAQAPYLIRPAEDNAGNAAWELIGEAYIHGIMMGEEIGRADETVVELC